MNLPDENTKYSNLRVLVVDDHMVIRNMITQNLRSLGIQEITSASNATDAFEEIKTKAEVERPYHIIFLDWHMPEIEGIDLLKRCRKNSQYDRTAFVMLTAEQEEKNILRAIESGATSYLVKPVARDAMKKNLQKIMGWLEKNHPGLKADEIAKSKGQKPAPLPNNLPEKIRDQLKPIVAKSLENIFSEMFDVKIIPEHELKDNKQMEMVCLGRLHQNNMLIILRFFFDQDLLRPLLRQLYAPNFLEDRAVYEDAACEIVNILCNQIKAFLNKHGYQLELDFPEVSRQDQKCKSAVSIMNIHFSLNEDQCFLVDLTSKAG